MVAWVIALAKSEEKKEYRWHRWPATVEIKR
jgi:hypothetical protein